MTTAVLSAVTTTADKLAGIREFQKRERGLIGRRTEMYVVQIGLAAKLHMILHGKPGVAKSMTIDGLLEHMPDLAKFKTQAYKASPPEQFLGPVSIKGMAEDRFVRIVDRKIADVEIAVIDELTRAPRAVLPAFQGMMVEREFDSGNGVQPVPLQSLIGSVNHIPDDEELSAFLDRFTLKLVVEPPQSQAQFVEILKGALRRRKLGKTPVPSELVIHAPEWETFQEFVTDVHIPDAVLDRFGELWANLLGAGIEPSVRRYVDTTAAMQAVAALDGRDECIEDDLQIAQHAMWTMPEEIPTVYAEVVKFASEWVKKRSELLDSFRDTLDRLGQVQSLVAAGATPSDRAEVRDSRGEVIEEDDGRGGRALPSLSTHGIKVVNEQRKLRTLVEKHIADATGQDTTELDAVLTQIDGASAWISDRLLGGLSL
jgi:MoxR-like ATPase